MLLRSMFLPSLLQSILFFIHVLCHQLIFFSIANESESKWSLSYIATWILTSVSLFALALSLNSNVETLSTVALCYIELHLIHSNE